MVAFWIAWHTRLVQNDAPAHWPLIACLSVLVIRLVYPAPAMLLLGVLLLLGAIWHFRGNVRRDGQQRFRFQRFANVGALALWVVWALMLVEYRSGAVCGRDIAFDPQRPIVCIGDSLTEGMIPDRGYPGQLETMVTATVMNEGASGISSGPAIGILERSFRHRPQAVIIEVGGHDFLKWHSRSSTKANLVKMIQLCRQNDCEPILMEIPRGFMIDPYACLERELAYQYDLQLIDDRWLRHVVLMSPAAPPGMWFKSHQLSDDGIHSNPKGSRAIAEFVTEALVQLYGPQIRK